MTRAVAVLLEHQKRIDQLLDTLQELNAAHPAAAGSGRRPEDSAG
jgi:fido (protein-threonine AMPylation protein)